MKTFKFSWCPSEGELWVQHRGALPRGVQAEQVLKLSRGKAAGAYIEQFMFKKSEIMPLYPPLALLQ